MSESNVIKGIIRIVKTPEGEAPLKIRERWVGTEIPTLYYSQVGGTVSGALSDKPVKIQAHYVVFQKDALDALEKREPEAAKWWHQAGFPEWAGASFIFNADEAEEVAPVQQRI